jgi:hypothetical protein
VPPQDDIDEPIFLEAAIKQRGVDRIVFGTEAPGSGRHVNPDTGRSGDDLVPLIDSFDFLSAEDKMAIINGNPKKVIPALARWDTTGVRQPVTAS